MKKRIACLLLALALLLCLLPATALAVNGADNAEITEDSTENSATAGIGNEKTVTVIGCKYTIDADYSIAPSAGNPEATATLTVKGEGGKIVVTSGHTLKVHNLGKIVVESGATLTIEAGATLDLSASTSTDSRPLQINDGGKLEIKGTLISKNDFSDMEQLGTMTISGTSAAAKVAGGAATYFGTGGYITLDANAVITSTPLTAGTYADGYKYVISGGTATTNNFQNKGKDELVVASGATLDATNGLAFNSETGASTKQLTVQSGGKLIATDATLAATVGKDGQQKITSGTYTADPTAYLDTKTYHAPLDNTTGTYTVGEHNFQYDSWKERVECEEDGYYLFKCTGCTAEQKETISCHRTGPWYSNSTSHWHKCSDCGIKLDEAAHDSATSCSVCGYPNRITAISLAIDTPAIGETPAQTTQKNAQGTVFSPSRPSWYEVNLLNWYKLASDKDPYKGGWTKMTDDETFTTGYYYRVSVDIFVDSSYTVDENITGTINGVATDTRFNSLVQPVLVPNYTEYPTIYFDDYFILEAFYEPLELTDIAVKVTEPSIGATPDYKPTYTVKSTGSAELSTSLPGLWIKVAKDDYVEGSFAKWEDVGEKEKFKAGYYYAFIIGFDVTDGNALGEDLTATINGKEATVEPQTDRETLAERAIVYKVYGPLTEKVNAPSTGDNSGLALWAALALVSAAALGAVVYRKKRSK